MTIINGGRRKRPLSREGDSRTPYARAGWNDARLGVPFNYALVDRAPRALGIAYERARSEVIRARLLGIAVPAWNASSIPSRIFGTKNALAEIQKGEAAEGIPRGWPIGKAGWQPADTAEQSATNVY